MTDQIVAETVDFVQRRESNAVKQALQAVKTLRDTLALKRDLRLPVLDETREDILVLEDEVHGLKLESLRPPHDPNQLELFPVDGNHDH